MFWQKSPQGRGLAARLSRGTGTAPPLDPALTDCRSRSWLDHQAGHCVIMMGYIILIITENRLHHSKHSIQEYSTVKWIRRHGTYVNVRRLKLQQRKSSPTWLIGESLLWNFSLLIRVSWPWKKWMDSHKFHTILFRKMVKKVNNGSV